jgi:hypothetical protein
LFPNILNVPQFQNICWLSLCNDFALHSDDETAILDAVRKLTICIQQKPHPQESQQTTNFVAATVAGETAFILFLRN